MFVDEIIIKVEAGKGGDGCTSFRREKFVPLGGPDGGNGGNGSNIVFKAEKGLKTLFDLRYQKTIKGHKGTNGQGSNRNGKNAEDVIIKVPMGTTIIDNETNLTIADLTHDGQEALIANGGRGGRGNKSFATKGNKAPTISEYGEPGQELTIKCELKVLADVGLVGLPSVGKSTLLSFVTSAKPKIAAYHFTTLSPNLGKVMLSDHRNFIIADLPGLIEGASEGAGLGDRFLRHTSRTRIILHIIDMSGSEARDPIEDYKIINNELKNYSTKLSNKNQLVVANKMDLPNADDNLKLFKKAFPKLEVIEISALNNIGIDKLMEKTADLLDEVDQDIYQEDEYDTSVVIEYKENKPFKITKQGDLWVLSGEEIEKLFKMTKFDNDDAVIRFGRKLKGMGVEEELEALGAKRGDEVAILDFIFLFKE